MNIITNNAATPLMEGIHDPIIFKAVFMAGTPGSGKSTVRKELFGGLGMKVTDVDEIRRAHIKLGKPADYATQGNLAQRLGYQYMRGRLGIIMDTTAWHLPSIADTTHKLRTMGYDVGMIHVFSPLDVSLARVKERAHITGRTVPEEEVEKRFASLKHNTTSYARMFGDHYWFVDNSGSFPKLSHVRSQIMSWLTTPSTSPAAQEWLAQQGR
jgi:predicted ABC-type ATPase